MEKRKHYGPVNRRYTVQYNQGSNTVYIIDTIRNMQRVFSPVEFIYGQVRFNDDTDKYPNYVHAELWAQYDGIKYVN